MRRSSAAAAAAALLCSVNLSAHRMDEYLQAARIGIEPGRVDVELYLTPGMAVFDSVIAAIDRDRDGIVSAVEKNDYVSAVLGAVTLRIDDRDLPLKTIAATFPELDALRRGQGIIQLRAGAALPALNDGAHELTFRNSHRPDVSVYLANALVPMSGRIAINAQRRDHAQIALAIDFTARSESKPASIAGWFAAAVAIVAVLIGGGHITRNARRFHRAMRHRTATL
ncbi:MAG: hypothetical protein K2Y23_10970 [Cyanobacteria bacterium]|nr:hypothetical protein [Cyanobacteriota bacterium]